MEKESSSQPFWKFFSIQMSSNLRSKVEHVDENQTKRDEKDNPGRDNIWGDKEGDPTHHYNYPEGRYTDKMKGPRERVRTICIPYTL